MKRKIIIAIILIVIGIPITIYTAAPGIVYRCIVSMERCRAGLSLRSIRVDDHRIVYLEGGTGPTVLLLHGFSAEKDHWARFARFLTPRFRVIIPDIPGFGESSKIEGDSYDTASQVERLERFVGLLGLKSFHLAGNSMGGRIACYLAVKNPGMILSLALFDSSGVTPPKKSEYQVAQARGKNLLLLQNAGDFDRVMKLNFAKPPWLPGRVKSYLGEKALASRPFNQKINDDLSKHPLDLQPLLGNVRAPALILWGDDDRILDPSAVGVFEKGLTKHLTVIMKKCGHSPMLERPEETAGHYLDFLKSL
jgi:abhydrolase domain-containing protein 6